jgi:two-component system chemotaxis response regulator CheB
MDGNTEFEAVVADDSHFVRTVVEDILEERDIHVVGAARNGREAVELVAEHRPDVVTMDVEMPEMDGLEAVERIMDETPTPILMLSAHTEENADVTFDALERGAVDVFSKPGGEVSTELSSHDERLAEAVSSVATADVARVEPSGSVGQSSIGTETPAGSASSSTQGTATTRTDVAEGDFVSRPTLVIAASTGGPSVVEAVLQDIPPEADFRVLIVQHMPSDFTDRFAERLDLNTDYDVREATDGDRIGGGEALVAPGGYHMDVSGYGNGRLRVKLTEDEPQHGVRPAADVTMRSAGETIDDPLVGVVLTGMGKDGAAGAEAMAAAGATIVVQDQESASVASMPRHAVQTGVTDITRRTPEIDDAILDSIRLDDE